VPTYRPLSRTDVAAYAELCRYSFNIPVENTPVYKKWVIRFLDYSLGAFDRERLLAGMWYNPFAMRVGDDFLPMGGVAAVATAPEARNLGLAKGLMLRAHRQMRREGRALATLRPFKYEFYARMGYGDAFHYLDAAFDPRQVASHHPVGYQVRRVDGLRNWRLLERLRHLHGRPYLGVVRRDKAYWDVRILYNLRGIRSSYLIEKRGEPVGYIVTDLGPDRKTAEIRLFIVEAIWKDQGALDAVMEFLRGHRDQVKKVCWYLPTDVRLHDQMIDPEIDVRLKPKMMLKLVDVKQAIESRSYDRDLSGHLVLDLEGDETSPWNAGRWSVRWDEGKARVTPLRGRLPRVGTARCNSGTLAILYSGRLSAGECVTDGRLDASPDSCRLLEQVFPCGTPYLAEWF